MPVDDEPMNLIADPDLLTCCPMDGTRTTWLGSGWDRDRFDGEYQIEKCPTCLRIYHVYDE